MRLLVLLLVAVFTSCNTSPDQRSSPDKKALDFGSDSTVIAMGSGILLRNFSLDSSDFSHKCRGIDISFEIESSPQAFNELSKHHYQAFFVDLHLKFQNTILYSLKTNEQKNIGQNIPLHQAHFLSTPGHRLIDVFIPFCQLRLPAGQDSIEIAINLFPVKTEPDSLKTEYQKLSFIGNHSLSSKTFGYTLHAPNLQSCILEVKNFELTKAARKHKYDFTITGKGYPDLYWELYCGENMLFASKPEKNSFRYETSYSSPFFTCCQEDLITLEILDYDNGPFNKKDRIDSWTGTLDELRKKKGILHFGKVQNFRFELHPKKQENKL